MANRVCLGQRSSDVGLFISKPGVNVLTAGSADMLLSTMAGTWQVVQTGQVSLANGGSAVISHPNLGYYPTVFILPHFTGFDLSPPAFEFPQLKTWCEHLSYSQVRIYLSQDFYTYSGTATYGVMRLPCGQ